MALFAPHHKLDNFIAFVDYNKLQIDGYTKEVLDLGDIEKKFADFGWNAMTINGHDVNAINDAINKAKNFKNKKPTMIVLDTIKGAGWSATENRVDSHARIISADDLKQALAEMQTAIDAL